MSTSLADKFTLSLHGEYLQAEEAMIVIKWYCSPIDLMVKPRVAKAVGAEVEGKEWSVKLWSNFRKG